MTKIEQLFIRAAKSRCPYDRLHSVYRRFYCKQKKSVAEEALFMILCDLCDKYKPMSNYTFARELLEAHKHGIALFSVPMYNLRFTEKSHFKDITWKKHRI